MQQRQQGRRSASAIGERKLTAVARLKECTKAGTGCGSCVPLVSEILTKELRKAGVVVSKRLCEHFAHSRQELYPPGAAAPDPRPSTI